MGAGWADDLWATLPSDVQSKTRFLGSSSDTVLAWLEPKKTHSSVKCPYPLHYAIGVYDEVDVRCSDSSIDMMIWIGMIYGTMEWRFKDSPCFPNIKHQTCPERWYVMICQRQGSDNCMLRHRTPVSHPARYELVDAGWYENKTSSTKNMPVCSM